MKHSFPWLALASLVLLLAPLTAAAQTAVPTPAAAAEAAVITVKVALESGKAGETAPADTKLAEAMWQDAAVTLYALNGQGPVYTLEGKTDAAGVADFTAVPYQDGYRFGVVAKIGLTTYITDLVTPEAGVRHVLVPVKVYGTTTDASKLRVSQAFVLAEAQGEGKLNIANFYVLSNDGDKTLEGGLKDAGGKAATLQFPLPSGAQDVRFDEDDGSGIALTNGGFLSRPGVQPGEEQARVLVSYSMPYSDSLRLESILAYPTDKLTVFVATPGITLTGSLMKPLGTQQRGDGVTMNVWGAEKLSANQAVSYELTGKAEEIPPPLPVSATKPTSQQGLMGLLSSRKPAELAGMGLMAAGLLLGIVAAGWWLYRSRFAPDPAKRQADAVLAALADLQEDREAGRVQAEDYEQRRQRLTDALASLVAPASMPDPDPS